MVFFAPSGRIANILTLYRRAYPFQVSSLKIRQMVRKMDKTNILFHVVNEYINTATSVYLRQTTMSSLYIYICI